jgi:hypothetical protein
MSGNLRIIMITSEEFSDRQTMNARAEAEMYRVVSRGTSPGWSSRARLNHRIAAG